MKKLIVLFTSLFLFSASPALSIYDPLSVNNNRIGVHILSPDEIESAAKLVNYNYQGSWGYVTVPIQATDRNREKWTAFMKKATELKIIPLVRIATNADGSNWLKPGNNDLIDFANFLNDIPWPVQNRYIILFNEVNRADEFGGTVSPEDYADILNNAIDIFKRRSDKFFILPSAMDNAAPNGGNFMRWDIYLKRMYDHRPEVFEKIDGWTSHAYGNPAFSASPALSGFNKVDSFKSDLKLINQYTKRKLPVFITEAGWSRQILDDRTIATFYNHALYNIWNNEQIVAVTPFLLFAGTEPFSYFSLLNKDQRPTLAYQTIETFATKGSPILEDYQTPTPTQKPEFVADEPTSPSSVVLGDSTIEERVPLGLWQKVINFIAKIFNFNHFDKTITVGDKKYHAEVVRSERDIEIGLAKYQKLEQDQAMYFDLATKRLHTFWMKNMKFDIDIIWIDGDLVVGISQGYYKAPYALINAPSPMDYVLEVNQNSGIKVGDRVKIN
ncbi:hypothetical protein A3A84_01080 [Candidatus Collierbacteria bacterium RIFCSPLOWO2_01_FULL_50_23]|uniref:Asl1-like glycosyl hydrolase catalytic domain-containing protein n=1 Tax=Candidatus Collierbacteria bacterium RIFCSPHIGHO2_01_FULL_50_25 TaxID=1817722 RepID=A0A1F5EVE9_9BACT|nr:MAG: hypothetical protein A2703_03625 [Candidatus Collierbacteria bacterium RIFCSPHIGHO2_01_FULL_50_25]OGD74046.1 MAG: hypothetical protein A3A84_01080 [Candidatus Collierbacteria bacterium RIFCSPLOWO2_01_FULL_50_23]